MVVMHSSGKCALKVSIHDIGAQNETELVHQRADYGGSTEAVHVVGLRR
jgi:hypothetical protein